VLHRMLFLIALNLCPTVLFLDFLKNFPKYFSKFAAIFFLGHPVYYTNTSD
jgi:hypothetical protein